MSKKEASKALAFKKKYQNIEQCPPEDVGKISIASNVYRRLKEKDEQLPDFINFEQRDALVAKLTTPELWQRYTAYRQLEEWLKSRNLENLVQLTMMGAYLDMVEERVCNMIWAEDVEKGIELTEDNAEHTRLLLCKMDAAMFANDDWKEYNSITGRSNILFAMNQINYYNTLVGLVAKEIKMPELASVFQLDIASEEKKIEWINGLIAALKERIFATYTEDGHIGTTKRHVFDMHLKPYQTEPDKIPAEHIAAAKKLIKGLKVFDDPLGGTTLDKAIKGLNGDVRLNYTYNKADQSLEL